jgi:GNAT superfamily N-acetyltransferase
MNEKLAFRRLLQSDVLDGFDAGTTEGELALTVYLRRYAKQHQRKQLSTTHLVVDGIAIAAFVTICPGIVEATSISGIAKGLPSQYSAPVVVLARMATDLQYRNQGIGRALVDRVVMPSANELATALGCCGVLTDAKPEAVGFYEKLGFHPVDAASPGKPTTCMFRPLR